MFLQLVILFLVSPVLLEARVVAPSSGSLVRRGQDSETIARFSESGNCFGYFGPKNDALSFAPCKIYCPKKFPGSDPNQVGCKGPGMAVEAFPDKSLIVKDEAGLAWVAGQCVCAPALEVAELILDVVVEGLAKLDEVICAVMLSTVQLFAESALDFIPVSAPLGAAVTAARIVEGAKTFVENGVAAASLFGDWIGPACKIPEFEFDLTRAFVNMVTSSDDLGVSKGCFKKNKADCAKPAAVPRKATPPPPDPSPPKADPPKVDEPKADPPKADPAKVDPPKADPPKADPPKADPAKPDAPVSAPSGPDVSRPGTDAPAPTAAPVNTKEPDSTTDHSNSESSASACRLLVRRAAARKDGLIERNLGDPMSAEVVCNGATTVHSTITQGPIGAYPLDIPKTCSKKWSQACYHYRSVISVFAQNTDMVRWTCQATPATSKSGTATVRWGSTAIGVIGGKDQHWFPWVNGFVPENNPKTGCERDEWPPRYFWPGDEVAAQKKMEQRVRLIPASMNGGAGGGLLRKFCDDNAAETVKGKATFVNPKFIKTINQNARTGPAVGGKTTVFTTVSVDTARAVFTIVDWDGLPNDPDFDGLKDNPCWPKALAPEDPGFVLLTNDEFYQKGQHPDLAQYTARYRELPDLQTLINAMGGPQAQAAGKLVPPFRFTAMGQADYDDEFRLHPIPDAYLEVLPGMPRPATATTGAATSTATGAPTSAATGAPTSAATGAPTSDPTSAETSDPTSAATSDPTSEETSAAPDPSAAPDRRRMASPFNGTLPDAPTNSPPANNDEDDDEDHVFRRWMEAYMERVRRYEEQERKAFRTVARTNAEPTPVGQGEPTPTPAAVGGRVVGVAVATAGF